MPPKAATATAKKFGVAPKTTADGFLADSFLGATAPPEVTAAVPLFEQTSVEDLERLWGIVYYIYSGREVPAAQLPFASQANVSALVAALLCILRYAHSKLHSAVGCRF
jgi:hypothetical protein